MQFLMLTTPGSHRVINDALPLGPQKSIFVSTINDATHVIQAGNFPHGLATFGPLLQADDRQAAIEDP